MKRAMLHRVPSNAREESGKLLDKARETQRSVEMPLEEVNEEMERHWETAFNEIPASARQAPANVPPLPLEELDRNRQEGNLESLPEFGKHQKDNDNDENDPTNQKN